MQEKAWWLDGAAPTLEEEMKGCESISLAAIDFSLFYSSCVTGNVPSDVDPGAAASLLFNLFSTRYGL